MQRIIEFLFPKQLARLAYFFRVLLWNVLVWFSFDFIEPEPLPEVIYGISILVYLVFFIILPRLRDAGMSAWWLILILVPVVDFFLGVVLLFSRTHPSRNPLFEAPLHRPTNFHEGA